MDEVRNVKTDVVGDGKIGGILWLDKFDVTIQKQMALKCDKEQSKEPMPLLVVFLPSNILNHD